MSASLRRLAAELGGYVVACEVRQEEDVAASHLREPFSAPTSTQMHLLAEMHVISFLLTRRRGVSEKAEKRKKIRESQTEEREFTG